MLVYQVTFSNPDGEQRTLIRRKRAFPDTKKYLEQSGFTINSVKEIPKPDTIPSTDITRLEVVDKLVEAMKNEFPMLIAPDATWQHTAWGILERLELTFRED